MPVAARFSRSVTPLAAATLALAAACVTGPEEHVFLELLGNDTMSVETFTRGPDRIEGRLVTRSPATRVADYVADLGPDGAIMRLAVDYATPLESPDGPPPQRLVVTFSGDSAYTERVRGETDTVAVAVVPGTIPIVSRIPMPMAFIDHAARLSVVEGTDNFQFGVYPAGGSRTSRNAIVRRGPDTVSIDFFGNPMLVAVDAEGGVLGLDGVLTTRQVTIEPAAGPVDVDALAAEFAARDARGEGIGVASPRAQVEATGGGARFEVNYSRPAKRGREIWGGLVPYDEVWRTGANSATHFTTSHDITIGSAQVAAGTYTLWTTFTAGEATLIVNTQTGQWGTAYDSQHDLARIPLSRTELDESVERFTIAIEATADGGMLSFSWDRTTFAVSIRVRR